MEYYALLKALRREFDIFAGSVGKNREITDLVFLEPGRPADQVGTLYFGYCTQMSGETLPPQCLLAAPDPERVELEAVNAGVVRQEQLFAVFNRAKELVLDRTACAGVAAQLREAVLDRVDLEGFLNLAAAKLTNSLIVLDRSFRVLAHSRVFPITDKLWVDNLARGYCNYEFISAVANLTGVVDAPDTEDAFVVSCYASPLRKLYSKIFHGDRQLGSVIMLEQESRISSFNMELLPLISRSLGKLLADSPLFLETAHTQYEELLYHAVIGATPVDLRGPILASGMRLSATMCALSIQSTRYLGQTHMRTHVRAQIKRILPNVVTTLHEDNLVCLVPLDGALILAGPQRARLAEFARTALVQIGVSNSFSNIEQFARYYAQARRALRLGAQTGDRAPLCDYERYSFYDLLDREDKSSLGLYCHPALSRLNHYDQQNQTDLYNTLAIYLEHNCKLTHTAKALFIHRNSLVYRLERIQEVGAIGLDDIETRFLLSASYQIDRFIGFGGDGRADKVHVKERLLP